jgi:hypothetical protein
MYTTPSAEIYRRIFPPFTNTIEGYILSENMEFRFFGTTFTT